MSAWSFYGCGKVQLWCDHFATVQNSKYHTLNIDAKYGHIIAEPVWAMAHKSVMDEWRLNTARAGQCADGETN